MMILWLVVGCVLVTIGFFLPGSSIELWPAVNGGGIAALIYLVSLLVFTLRSKFSDKQRTSIIIVATITIISIGTAWSGLYEDAHWRKEKLQDVRAIIDRGILRWYQPGPRVLLDNLREYYSQPNGKHQTLQQVFLKNHPGAAIGSDIRKVADQYDTVFTVSIVALSDTQIVLMATDHIARGIDPNFKNIDGRLGRIQERFVLTEKGVRHDILN